MMASRSPASLPARARPNARERILEAAYELFSRLGIRAVGAPADAPPRGPVDESLELAQKALGADAYAAAWADGAQLSMEQAIARALQVVATPEVRAEGT